MTSAAGSASDTRREAAEVGEHHGRLHRHAAEAQVAVRALEDVVDDRGGHEAGEDVPDALALEGRQEIVRPDRPDGRDDERAEGVDERDDAARR